jgi:hypothetical protein
MTQEALHRIEQRFGIILPDWYCRQVLAVSKSLPIFPIYSDEQRIIRVNEELRREGWFFSDWPPDFFAISETGSGDYYFIVPSTGDRRVFVTDHEHAGRLSPTSLDEMVGSETIDELLGEIPMD